MLNHLYDIIFTKGISFARISNLASPAMFCLYFREKGFYANIDSCGGHKGGLGPRGQMPRPQRPSLVCKKGPD
jgi:hypothetical protein